VDKGNSSIPILNHGFGFYGFFHHEPTRPADNSEHGQIIGDGFSFLSGGRGLTSFSPALNIESKDEQKRVTIYLFNLYPKKQIPATLGGCINLSILETQFLEFSRINYSLLDYDKMTISDGQILTPSARVSLVYFIP